MIIEFKNDYNIILTATKNDRKLTSTILEGIVSDNVVDLTGKTSISDLIFISQHSDLVVTLDSGSAHIAWAAGAKSILSLFFATSAKRTAPFGSNYFSISANEDCVPCMSKKCKLKCNKNKCIDSISTEYVIKKVKDILNQIY